MGVVSVHIIDHIIFPCASASRASFLSLLSFRSLLFFSFRSRTRQMNLFRATPGFPNATVPQVRVRSLDANLGILAFVNPQMSFFYLPDREWTRSCRTLWFFCDNLLIVRTTSTGTSGEAMGQMFSMQPIGYVRSPYQNRSAVPRGLGAKHDAEGVLEILPELERGLMDIEGFSHLFVIWVFDRSEGCDLMATLHSDTPHEV